MSTISDDEKLAVAARYAAASGGGDPTARAALYAPGCTAWHNFDEAEAPMDQGEKTLAWMRKRVQDLTWNEIATFATANGFVAQTVITGTAPGGPLRLHSCVIATLDDSGLITHIEEYLDTAQSAPLRG